MKCFSCSIVHTLLFQSVLVFFFVHASYGQEPTSFTRADYDLKGNVKTCLVITDYGKEEFEFNKAGYLTRLTTRYSDTDYDISYYKYKDEELLEKRLENYREGKLDPRTSIANIFSIDTTAGKTVTEKIYSYQNEFLDQYEYTYDEKKRLVKIRRSNNEGIDETNVVYDSLKGEVTQTYELNGVVQKSIRTSIAKKKNEMPLTVVLVKEFLEGNPLKAREQSLDTIGRLLKEQNFGFKEKKGSFELENVVEYRYNEDELLSEKIITAGKSVQKKEYVYQLDGKEFGNWIKQIVLPDNTYSTRKITYFEEEPKLEE
ncbi:MAG: hypothetical protein HKN52_05190 [Eudoraea sp.]|nr:hypothetical protein [Eudoraea sp.]